MRLFERIAAKKQFVLIVLIALFLDRFSKSFTLNYLAEGEGFPVINNFFHITRVNNTGAAFGMFKGSLPLLIVISFLFVIACLIFFFSRRESLFLRWPWALVLAGAMGNLYDRVVYGYVIDFLDFRIWPVFNVADASICIGVFFILINSFRK